MISEISKWLLIVCFFFAAEASADEVKLSADDIRTTLSGNTMVEKNPPRGGGSVTVKWKSKGKVSAKTEEGYSDKGKWWLKGDQYCRQWKKWDKQKKRCWTFTLDGSTLSWYNEKGEKEGSGELLRAGSGE